MNNIEVRNSLDKSNVSFQDILELNSKISKNLILVLASSNELIYTRNWKIRFQTKVALSKNGFGNEIWSWKTPSWLHKVCNLIWEGSDKMQIFKSRQKHEILEKYSQEPNIYPYVLSRILQLDGMRASNSNTKLRNIYIHWTPQTRYFESNNLNRTHWCVTLPPDKMIDLFDEVKTSKDEIYVYIHPQLSSNDLSVDMRA